MIKQFDDMFVPKERPWLTYSVFGGAFLGGAVMILALIKDINYLRLIPFTMVPWVFFCGWNYADQEKRRRAIYHAYLDEVAVDELKKAAKSPELNEQTKSEVTAYLNVRHPGWSMA